MLQKKYITVEEAEKLDWAYRYLFNKTTKFCEYFSSPIDPPFAPVLAQKLAKPVSGVVSGLNSSSAGHTELVTAEAPPLAEPPISIEMTIEIAMWFFGYDTTYKFTREELFSRYQRLKEKNKNRQEVLNDLGIAFQVLLKIAA